MNVGFSSKVWGEDGSTLPAGEAIEEEIGEHPMGEDGGVKASDQNGGATRSCRCSVETGTDENTTSHQPG